MTRYRIVLTDEAEADLSGLRNWLESVTSARTAHRFMSALFDHLASFADMPHRGTVRSYRAGGIRVTGWRRTITLVFTVDEHRSAVVFIGVLYRGRDVEAAIRQRTPDEEAD